MKKHEEKLAEKDDNLAVESKVVVTKVKPGKAAASSKKSSTSKPKVEKLAKAAERAAYSPPAPKFIIKQAGKIIHRHFVLIITLSYSLGVFSHDAKFLRASHSAFMRQMKGGRSSQLIGSPHTSLITS